MTRKQEKALLRFVNWYAEIYRHNEPNKCLGCEHYKYRPLSIFDGEYYCEVKKCLK